MKFKEEHMKKQFEELDPLLQEMCYEFEKQANSLGRDAIVTRVSDPFPGESGVHPLKRAVDFRDEIVTNEIRAKLFTAPEVEQIVDFLNQSYERNDGKETCIHHSFNGGPYHFHIQLASRMDAYVKPRTS